MITNDKYLIFLYEQVKIKIAHLKNYSSKCSQSILIDLLPVDLINYLCMIIIEVYYDFSFNFPNSSALNIESTDELIIFIIRDIEKKILIHKQCNFLIKRINFTKFYSLFFYNNILTSEDEKIFFWFLNIISRFKFNTTEVPSFKLLHIICIHVILTTLFIFISVVNNQHLIDPIFCQDNLHSRYLIFNLNSKLWLQNTNQILLLNLYRLYPIYVIKKKIIIRKYVFFPYFKNKDFLS